MEKNAFFWALLAASILSVSAAAATGSISITSMTIPTSVSQGDTFSIVMSVSGSSASGVAGSLTLPSGISCTPTGSQTISLSGSGTGSATWSCSASVSGDYSNRITASVTATDSGTGGSLSASTQTGLSVLSPASLTASSVISASSISAGGTATFTVGVNNLGDSSTTFSISLGGCSSGISCSPGSVSSTSISGASLVNSQFTVTGSTAGAYTITATVSSPTQSDISTSQAITVTSSSSTNTTSSSSGGGGGGGGTTTTSGISKSWAAILNGETATMAISSTLVDLTKVAFTAGAAVSNVKVTVAKLGSRPSSISQDPSGAIYQYISITKENISDSQINSATIEFKVNKTWMSANSIQDAGIALNRYSGGSWTALSTTPAQSDAQYSYFSAASPGFSYFAISGAKAAAATPPAATAPPSPSTTPSETSTENKTAASQENKESGESGTSGKAAAYILIALAIIGAVFMYYEKKKKPASGAGWSSGGWAPAKK